MTIRLQEYGGRVRIDLDDARTQLLRNYSQDLKRRLGLNRLPIVIDETSTGKFISAGGFAGVFSVHGIQIEVAPKFLPQSPGREWKDAFFSILSHLGYTTTNWADCLGESLSEIPDFAASVITSTLEIAERRGDARNYVERRENWSGVRGSIDTSIYWKRILDPGMINCVFQEFSADIAPNQLMKWALRSLIPEVSSRALIARMRHRLDRLSTVSDTGPLYRENELLLSQQFSYCEPGVAVAKLVADNQLAGVNAVSGSVGLELVWNTATIFEDFVFLLFSEASRSMGGSVRKEAETLATSPKLRDVGIDSFATTPDLQIDIPSGRLIFDAKYKNLSKSPENSDVYQVITGAKLLGATRCGLVYPGTCRTTSRRRWDLKVPGKPRHLEVCVIDLTAMSRKTGLKELLQTVQQWLMDAP